MSMLIVCGLRDGCEIVQKRISDKYQIPCLIGDCYDKFGNLKFQRIHVVHNDNDFLFDGCKADWKVSYRSVDQLYESIDCIMNGGF